MVEQHRDGFIYPFFITDWCQAELVKANSSDRVFDRLKLINKL
jgi:hypothetical protein